MDIEGFLLASGFGLLVVLLGWASQITSKSKETKELEATFLEKAKLKKDDYKKIVDKRGSTQDSFSALVDFLYSGQEEHVEIFQKIKDIKRDLERLNRKYSSRFWVLFLMSISLFVCGIVSFFLCPQCKFWALLPNTVFVIIVFCNLVSVHNLEKRYTKNISDTMEKL